MRQSPDTRLAHSGRNLMVALALMVAVDAARAQAPDPLPAPSAVPAERHAPNPNLLAKAWPSFWITCPGAPERDYTVLYFQKQVRLASVAPHVWVHVSADNRFSLRVNGAFVGEGPARGDPLHWRFETLDLAPFLKVGDNVVAAVVWNAGTAAPLAQMSNRTAFLMQGDTGAESDWNTGSGWRVKQETARTPMLDQVGTPYSPAGLGERVDGARLDFEWDQATTTAAGGWLTPLVVSKAAAREAQDAGANWKLVQDALPPMERQSLEPGKLVRATGITGSSTFPAVAVTIPAHTHASLLLDYDALETAYPELVVSGGAGAQVKVTYSEALYDDAGNKGNRDEIAGRHIAGLADLFLIGGGKGNSYTTLWWRTWRYLQLDVETGAEPLTLDRFAATFTAYPFVKKASISADIPDLDRLWETGWRTARLSAHETYMDAPYWEQLQYVADTRIEQLVSFVMTGDSRLARQAVEAIEASITSDGLTQSRYPSAVSQFIPPFSLLWISMLHDYWMYVDDPATVKEAVPKTRGVLDWYIARLRPDHLVGAAGWWEFADWTQQYPRGVPPQQKDGGSVYLTLQFIGGLKDAIDLEEQFGDRQRAAQYRTLIAESSDAINDLAWDKKSGLYADTTDRVSFGQQVNILAVWLDVAPRERQQAIMQRVLASREKVSTTLDGQSIPPLAQASYYFRFYLSRALEHAGLADLYLDQLGPWRNMLSLGLRTWAERPEPTRSDCHAWSASPNYDLLTLVAGIHPGAAGFSTVVIAPHLANLTHLEAAMPVRGEMIRVTYKLERKVWSASVDLPPSMSGRLVWQAATYPLHPGHQTIQLPQDVSR